MEDELAAWGRGVNLLRQADELNTTLLKTLEPLDQVGQRAPCPIQFPDNERIPWRYIGQRLVQTFPLSLRSGHLVHKPFLAACFFERVYLECLVLLLFGDAYIPNLHKLLHMSQVSRQQPVKKRVFLPIKNYEDAHFITFRYRPFLQHSQN